MKPNDKAYREFMRVFHKTHLNNESQIMASLEAAYAAQFQSEDYKWLVRELRMRPHRRGYETEDEAKERRQKEREEAADALEALLAERDAYRNWLGNYEKQFAAKVEELVTVRLERDTLAARLAPVDDKELGERVVNEIRKQLPASGVMYIHIANAARAAIAAIRPHIEAAEMERCAKIAEGSFLFDVETWLNSTKKEMTAHLGNAIAAAIRSGK